MAVHKETRWDIVNQWVEKHVLKWFFLFVVVYIIAQIVRSLI